jgi:hypothetical protein
LRKWFWKCSEKGRNWRKEDEGGGYGGIRELVGKRVKWPG